MISYTSKDHIFHYTNVEKALKYILPTLKLRFNNYSSSHDPREYKDPRVGPKYSVTRYDNNRVSSVQDRILMDRFEKYKVICFCRNPNSRKSRRYGWRKPRMWAQYSDNQTGICLVFSRKRLVNQLSRSFDSKSIIFGNVKYEDFCIPKFKPYQNINVKKLSSLTDDEYIIYHLNLHKKEFFLVKDLDFKDENEFRIILKDSSPEKQYLNILNSLRGIILGDKLPTDNVFLFQTLRDKIQLQQDNDYSDHEIMNLHKMHFDEGLPTLHRIN